MTKNSRVQVGAAVMIATLGLVAIAIGVAHAQPPAATPGGMMMGRGMMGGRGLAALRMGLAQLNLTDQQKQQVRGIVQGHREQLRAFAAQARQARVALGDAVAGGADEATIRARAADLAKVQADLAVFGAQVRKEVMGVLTPEQQAKAKELRQQRQDRMQKWLQERKKMLEF